jgi:cell division protein FtsB
VEKKKITRLFIFLLALIAIFLPGYSKHQELVQKNRELQDRIDRLEATNKKFRSELDRLENDPSYLEKIAREKMKVIKKGEIIYK